MVSGWLNRVSRVTRRLGDGGKRLGRFANPDCTLSNNFQQQMSGRAFPP